MFVKKKFRPYCRLEYCRKDWLEQFGQERCGRYSRQSQPAERRVELYHLENYRTASPDIRALDSARLANRANAIPERSAPRIASDADSGATGQGQAASGAEQWRRLRRAPRSPEAQSACQSIARKTVIVIAVKNYSPST